MYYYIDCLSKLNKPKWNRLYRSLLAYVYVVFRPKYISGLCVLYSWPIHIWSKVECTAHGGNKQHMKHVSKHPKNNPTPTIEIISMRTIFSGLLYFPSFSVFTLFPLLNPCLQPACMFVCAPLLLHSNGGFFSLRLSPVLRRIDEVKRPSIVYASSVPF